jgi:ribonuclease-3
MKRQEPFEKRLAEFLRTLGLDPSELPPEPLREAFVHRSYRTEAKLAIDNERLELLGDSVIGLVCTEYLLEHFPAGDEGMLAKRRSVMVSRVMLGELAREMGLGDLLLLGIGEEKSGGRERSSTLGSTLEAFCGALYLVLPWPEVRRVVREIVAVPAAQIVAEGPEIDAKSALQEWAQSRGTQSLEYRLIDSSGPDHCREFLVEVWFGGECIGRGSGPRKRTAENAAALEALIGLGIKAG